MDLPARVLALSKPVQLVTKERRTEMCVPVSSGASTKGRSRNADVSARAAQPFVLRLDQLPSTPQIRKRIEDRLRALNRRLELSGTPFRLRLL
jgi:hypothetical protein